MLKIKGLLFIGLTIVLFYIRFVNISWGLPNPFHPDERNMAIAVQNLKCETQNSKFKIQNCLNPRFFAYGQFPLYLGYMGVMVMKFFDGDLGTPISFQEAVISLRGISALASILTLFVSLAIIKLVKLGRSDRFGWWKTVLAFLILIFSPGLIQSAHFGTTESLLILFYSIIVYLTVKNIVLGARIQPLRLNWIIVICGLAIATKISSFIFIVVPITEILIRSQTAKEKIFAAARLVAFILLISVVFSPHNLISLHNFLTSVGYESDVALGKLTVFYTRQFVGSVPIIFQAIKIFPYALGWPALVLGILGFLGLSWRDKEINLLRFSFLAYFLANAFLFAKWTRFMAPLFPIVLLFAILFLFRIKVIRIIKVIIIIISILPGLAYLSVYQNLDVRFTASEWIYKNIPENSYILSETANVVDLPVYVKGQKSKVKNYNFISFNYYDLDIDLKLQEELGRHLKLADYIFIPSRRVLKNHPADRYPVLNKYYEDLNSGKLGFRKVAEFSSYPMISLLGKTLIEFPDENAEETWSVFDHPVVRIYKRINKI